MFDVNALAPMVGCAEQVQAFPHGCADNATMEGELLSPLPPGKRQLCDKVILEDAIAKLHKASGALKAHGTPFFLAAGFRKPHTCAQTPLPARVYYMRLTPPVRVPQAVALSSAVPRLLLKGSDGGCCCAWSAGQICPRYCDKLVRLPGSLRADGQEGRDGQPSGLL